jgi:hypothetical protein
MVFEVLYRETDTVSTAAELEGCSCVTQSAAGVQSEGAKLPGSLWPPRRKREVRKRKLLPLARPVD